MIHSTEHPRTDSFRPSEYRVEVTGILVADATRHFSDREIGVSKEQLFALAHAEGVEILDRALVKQSLEQPAKILRGDVEDVRHLVDGQRAGILLLDE